MKRKEPRVQTMGGFNYVYGRSSATELWRGNHTFQSFVDTPEFPLNSAHVLEPDAAREFCRTHEPPGMKKPKRGFTDTERIDFLCKHGHTRREFDAAMRRARAK